MECSRKTGLHDLLGAHTARREERLLAGQQAGKVATVALGQHVLRVLLQLLPMASAIWAAARRLQLHHDGEQPPHRLPRIKLVLLHGNRAVSAPAPCQLISISQDGIQPSLCLSCVEVILLHGNMTLPADDALVA